MHTGKVLSFQHCRLAVSCLCVLTLSACLSASVSTSSGGGGQDASSCISIRQPADDATTSTVSNSCEASVNFIEFSTGSAGLVIIAGKSSVSLDGQIFGWGACVDPSIPERVEDFSYICKN